MKSHVLIITILYNAGVVCMLLLSGCGLMPTKDIEGARIDVVVNELKKQVIDIGSYDVTDASTSGTTCGARIVAMPSSATLILKAVVNKTISGSGSAQIPTAYITFAPSGSGSYSDIKTVTMTLDTGFDQKSVPPAKHSLKISQDAPVATLKNDIFPNLGTVVYSALQGFLNANHDAKPCLLPKTLKVQADFEVKKVGDTGIQVTFLVFKVGSDISLTNDYTQSIVVTMDLSGTYGVTN
jgi:hypothetical protein